MIAKGKTLVACMEFHCIQLVIRQQLKIDKQIYYKSDFRSMREL